MIVGLAVCLGILTGCMVVARGEAGGVGSHGSKSALAKPQIILNGLPVEFDPIICGEQGQVFAPLNSLAEALAAEVILGPTNQQLIVRRDNTQLLVLTSGKRVNLTSNPERAYITGKIVNGQVLVPVASIAEHFGDDWQWDALKRTGYLRGGVPWTDADYIAFARWGEILWLQATFAKNPMVLHERGLETPPAFNDIGDLQTFLSAYWTWPAIQHLWEEGNKGRQVDGDWGFHGEGGIDPINAHKWQMTFWSPQEIWVEAVILDREIWFCGEQKVKYIIRPDQYGAFKIEERYIGSQL
ncbi:MAG: copper amine oxidase N-terminal domain-containing protein [Heliobacteriaceae bacterium]|nr:copper amine oxidase N-terminal domain-containing protein [Heliobacteriaceae bacterium]MDD4587330.1 copper amine oxidase N-terminal domain-containing protein [Heliobacteriaceae bacterium]